MACSKNIYPGGPQLIAKAKEIANLLGKADFEGTSGSLCKWKKCYNVKRVSICGAVWGCSRRHCNFMEGTIARNLRGYDKRDVFNIDKTGCFWRALPDLVDLVRSERNVRVGSGVNADSPLHFW